MTSPARPEDAGWCPVAEVKITEEFDNAQGLWANYDVYDPTAGGLLQVLHDQHHVDLRSFDQTALTAPASMFWMDRQTMTQLDALTMDDFSTARVIDPGEEWQIIDGAGTIAVGPDGFRNNWLLLRATITSGNHLTVVSSMPDRPVDLSSFEDGDWLTFAVPGGLGGTFDASQSLLLLSSNDDGAVIGSTNTISLSWALSDVSLSGSNAEVRLPWDVVRAAAADVMDLSRVTGVGFRFWGSGSIKVGGLRAVDDTWRYLPVDIDTRRQLLHRPVSRDGLTTASYEIGTAFPILWRASDPSGANDPRPIDSRMMTVFNSGAMSAQNRISLYFREETKDYMTQLDLNDMTMEELDALDGQPDSGPALYRSRTQDELEGLTQDELEGRTQFDLERVPDELASSWIRVILSWDTTQTQVTVDDTEGNNYVWTADILDPDTKYVLLIKLEDSSIRVRVYPLLADGSIDRSTVVIDSTTVIDDALLMRRPGRIGWLFDLVDGDATIETVRSRGHTFAEWMSSPFESPTPVAGAQLFAQSSPDRQLYTGLEPNPWSAPEATTYFELDTDHNRTTSGESVKITSAGTKTLQGVQSNLMRIENFSQTMIQFDVWYPTSPIDLAAYLLSDEQTLHELVLPRIRPDQWQTIKIDLSRLDDEPTGRFRLLLLQHEAGYPTTWWLDRVAVRERTVSWGGRSVLEDPWGDADAPFTAFGDMINSVEAGVLFPQRDRFLQVRGRAHRQDAWIDTVRFKPRYAQLGRLVWDDEHVPGPTPTADFTHALSSGVVSFDGRASTIGSGSIVNYAWSLGDGEIRYGPQIDHHFIVPGNYTVTLTVTSDRGEIASDAQVVTG